ncbi:MAG: RNA methyltransferase, partial [Candidatus Woesearchaeota archaeon]
MISVVLYEPEHPGNVGAVARVMHNFGFKDLVLVNPKCNHLSSEAIARSKHANSILAKAKVVKKLQGFDCLVGTTARLGTDYNLPRSPLLPGKLGEIVPASGKVWLVFGSEGSGLSNDMIRK